MSWNAARLYCGHQDFITYQLCLFSTWCYRSRYYWDWRSIRWQLTKLPLQLIPNKRFVSRFIMLNYYVELLGCSGIPSAPSLFLFSSIVVLQSDVTSSRCQGEHILKCFSSFRRSDMAFGSSVILKRGGTDGGRREERLPARIRCFLGWGGGGSGQRLFSSSNTVK